MKAAADAEVPSRFGGFVCGQELGRGASGIVYTCRRRSNPAQHFAAKAIDLRRLWLSARAEREMKKLQREVDILRRVPRHRNLVHFIDAVEEGHWFFLVLEFVGGGDLFSALVRRPSGPSKRPCFREAETVFVLHQLVEGLEFLHAQGVIHRDLKLENVLVVKETEDGTNILCDVKITDFGLSKVVGDGFSVAHSTVGSPRYIAPEVLDRGEHDFRADLWSLGVLLYVLLVGRFPVDGTPEVSQLLLDGKIAKLAVSEAAQAVLVGLLQVERERRLTLQALRSHEWLGTGPSDPTVLVEMVEPPLKRPRSEGQAVPDCSLELFGSECEAAGGGGGKAAPPAERLSDDVVVECQANGHHAPPRSPPPAPPMPLCKVDDDADVIEIDE